MNPVFCGKCGEQLRRYAGLHSAGEPFIETDEIGPHIRCPKCQHANRDLSSHRLQERTDESR